MLWRSFKLKFEYEFSVIIYFIITYIICRLFNTAYIFYKLTGFRCPTCGMLRALLELLEGDISSYINYNAMALPVAIVFAAELFANRMGKYQKFVHILCVLILILNLLYYQKYIF